VVVVDWVVTALEGGCVVDNDWDGLWDVCYLGEETLALSYLCSEFWPAGLSAPATFIVSVV